MPRTHTVFFNSAGDMRLSNLRIAVNLLGEEAD